MLQAIFCCKQFRLYPANQCTMVSAVKVLFLVAFCVGNYDIVPTRLFLVEFVSEFAD